MLKAYAVLNNDDYTGGIFFAKNNITARKAGANEYADGEIGEVTCKRAPFADAYRKNKKVPVSVKIDHGWHYECNSCGIRIDEDLSYRFGENEEHEAESFKRYENWNSEKIVEDGSLVYCDQKCSENHKLDEAQRKTQESRHRLRLERFLIKRLSGIHLVNKEGYRSYVHIYCSRNSNGKITLQQASIPFEYPGMKYGQGSLNFQRTVHHKSQRRLSYNCASGDIEVFTEFLRQAGVKSRPAQMNTNTRFTK